MGVDIYANVGGALWFGYFCGKYRRMKTFFTLIMFVLLIETQAQFVDLAGPVDTMLVNINDPAETAHLYWNVVNVSGSTKLIGCSREMILAIPGTEHQFCWDITCYPYSNTDLATPIADFVQVANGDSVLFAASYRHFGIAGMSVVKHCWFTTAGDSLCFETRYCSDATCSVMAATTEVSSEREIFRVSPNPISATAMIYLPKVSVSGSRLELYNSTGQLIKSAGIPSGSRMVMLGVEEFPEGSYFLSLVNAMGTRSSQRIMVSH